MVNSLGNYYKVYLRRQNISQKYSTQVQIFNKNFAADIFISSKAKGSFPSCFNKTIQPNLKFLALQSN